MYIPPPNTFYYVVLFVIWPIVAYKLFKRYSLERSTVLLFLLPYLFLPVPHQEITPVKLPLLPALDKEAVPVLVALALIYVNKIKIDYLPSFRLSAVCCVALLLSPFLTVLTNGDPMVFPTRTIPGLKFTEALSIFVALYIKIYAPFVIGYSLLGSNVAHQEFIKSIFVLGLIYSVLMLYEIRMSPQFHTMFYGYFPHEWIQQKRAGGFRPVVFLGHGLLVAFYCALTTIAAFVLWRMRDPILRGKGLFIFLYLCVVLVLCKTYSAVIYLLIFLGLTTVVMAGVRLRIVAIVAVVIMLFPMLRGFLPLTDVVGFFRDLNPDRADSLQFRFNNEDLLLARANDRPLFGWGTWGRNRIYHPVTGEDLSVTDGAWIITYGMFGWLGYIGSIGILTYPLIVLKRSLNGKNKKEFSVYTSALAVMLMIIAIDQIPNASLNHISYLMAGALLARAKQLSEFKEGSPSVPAGRANLGGSQ